MRSIEVGVSNDNFVEVTKGIEVGEQIVQNTLAVLGEDTLEKRAGRATGDTDDTWEDRQTETAGAGIDPGESAGTSDKSSDVGG